MQGSGSRFETNVSIRHRAFRPGQTASGGWSRSESKDGEQGCRHACRKTRQTGARRHDPAICRPSREIADLVSNFLLSACWRYESLLPIAYPMALGMSKLFQTSVFRPRLPVPTVFWSPQHLIPYLPITPRTAGPIGLKFQGIKSQICLGIAIILTIMYSKVNFWG